MKTRIATLCMMMITLSAAAMPYTDARDKALNLSDKMQKAGKNISEDILQQVKTILLNLF